MLDFTFAPAPAADAQKILAELGASVSWPYIRDRETMHIDTKIDAATTVVEVAPLAFYEDYKIYALADATKPGPDNKRYVLWKAGSLVLMNWTNEPVYALNEQMNLKLDRKTIVPYAKFFFHFVRGEMGRFLIVEKPEEVTWLPNATPEQKEQVNKQLMPVTYKGIGRDNLYTLTCTVVFQDALFRTDIKVAAYEMDATDDAGQPEHYMMGQMKLTNEEPLLENLSIPKAGAPGEFG